MRRDGEDEGEGEGEGGRGEGGSHPQLVRLGVQ